MPLIKRLTATVVLTLISCVGMAQTPFNATFDASPSTACAPTPCSEFTINLGGEDFVFTFTTEGDGGDMVWRNQYGEGDSGAMDCLSTIPNLATTEMITINRADNEGFEFNSIFIHNTASEGVAIAGFLDGTRVGASQNVPTNTPGGTFSFGGILVDEVRITGQEIYNFNIDSFSGAVPPPNTAPALTTSGGVTPAQEQTSIPVDANLTVTDAENPTLSSARIAVSTGFAIGQDVLQFANDGATMGNIAASFNAGTGVLTLTSAGASATIAQWQSALRAVTYENISDAPNLTNRIIAFSVNDGTVDGTASNKTVSVTAINDGPTITAPEQIIIGSDNAVATTGISYSDPDAGAASVTASFSVPKGVLSATSGAGVTISGSGTSALSAAGSVADLNAFIAASNLEYTKAVGPAEDITMNIAVNDNGNSGAGGSLFATDSLTLSITVPVSLSGFTVE